MGNLFASSSIQELSSVLIPKNIGSMVRESAYAQFSHYHSFWSTRFLVQSKFITGTNNWRSCLLTHSQCEFFYPGAKIPVFKKEVMSVLPVEPPIKRGPSFSAELGKLLPPMADTGTEEEQPEFPGTKKPRVSAVLTVRRKPDLPISGSPKLPDSKTSSLEQSPLCLLANNTLQQVELASRQRQEFSSLVSQVSPPKLGPISPAMLAAVNFTSQLISMPMNSPLSFSAYNSGLLPNNLPTTNHTLPLSSLPANAVAANLLKQMNPTGTFPLMQLPPPVKASQIAQQQQQPSTPNRSRHSTTTTPATQTSQHNSTTPQQSRGAGGLKISSILS
ncbi:hypothetical protein Pelo_3276 [Pelomyxa schiedti]|nr:hypothetical protein Pelo_3276 [Pelomyxa schiedti]